MSAKCGVVWWVVKSGPFGGYRDDGSHRNGSLASCFGHSKCAETRKKCGCHLRAVFLNLLVVVWVAVVIGTVFEAFFFWPFKMR